MFERRRPTHGFRFAPHDVVVLLVGASTAWPLWRLIGDFALLVPVTVIHFFLFCNVFRIRRAAELAWAGTFLANFAAWGLSGSFSWWGVLAIQVPLTIAILIVEVRHPSYHGVGSRPREEAP